MATRAQLRSRARTRADQDNSTFPTDTQYNEYLDDAAKEVWYDLIQAGWPIRWSSTVITAAGSQFTALGVSGVAFIRGVYRQEGGRYFEVPRIPEGDRADLLSTQASGGRATGYTIVTDSTGISIELLPRASGPYLVEYVTEYAGFSGDSDTWLGPARSDTLIVLKAAAAGCRKEGNDQGAAQLDREYVLLLEKVTNMASWLDMRNPPTIRDTRDQLMPRRDAFDFDI